MTILSGHRLYAVNKGEPWANLPKHHEITKQMSKSSHIIDLPVLNIYDLFMVNRFYDFVRPCVLAGDGCFFCLFDDLEHGFEPRFKSGSGGYSRHFGRNPGGCGKAFV